jgi:hypothetical protein
LAGRSKTRQGQDAKQVELKLRAKIYVHDQGTSQAKTQSQGMPVESGLLQQRKAETAQGAV